MTCKAQIAAINCALREIRKGNHTNARGHVDVAIKYETGHAEHQLAMAYYRLVCFDGYLARLLLLEAKQILREAQD